jgi:hypothetical protein
MSETFTLKLETKKAYQKDVVDYKQKTREPEKV